MELTCSKCGNIILVDGGRIPPWCSKCGAELKREPDIVGTGKRRSLAATADAVLSEQLEKERRDRFSFHNFGAGALLAAWGFFMGLVSSGQDPTDKVFAAHPHLMQWINWLQIATCINGLILCLVGYGIRQRKPWAYALATGCACLLIFGGVLFFIAFNRIGNGKELMDGVAKVRLIRENFDMLIGLVEGGALLVFLWRYRAQGRFAFR